MTAKNHARQCFFRSRPRRHHGVRAALGWQQQDRLIEPPGSHDATVINFLAIRRRPQAAKQRHARKMHYGVNTVKPRRFNDISQQIHMPIRHPGLPHNYLAVEYRQLMTLVGQKIDERSADIPGSAGDYDLRIFMIQSGRATRYGCGDFAVRRAAAVVA